MRDRERDTTKSQRVPASLEKPESCHQKMQKQQKDGAVQPGGGGTIWMTVQDCDEKDRGLPITERMALEAVESWTSCSRNFQHQWSHSRKLKATTVDGSRNRCGS